MVTATAEAMATASASGQPTPQVPPTLLVSGAQLGGPISAFDSALGAEVAGGIWDLSLGGYNVQLSVQSAISGEQGSINSADSATRVFTLTALYLQSTPSAAVMLAQARQFMPADARLLRVNTAVSPAERIYQSVALGRSFTAQSFQNNAGATVAPGTFNYVANPNGWTLVIGQE
jgi:hypothetical protein